MRKEVYGVHLTSSVTKSKDDLSIILFKGFEQLKLNCEMRILLPKTSRRRTGVNFTNNDRKIAVRHTRPLKVSVVEKIFSDLNNTRFL